ncbi:MAG: hypothetical protein WC438_02665 [Candidatus Pacearchaeota archaeon]
MMQIKFLKSIIEHLTNKSAVAIVDLLAGKKDVNEFLIAKKLNLTINQTRNILYTLSDFGLVSFIRKKDKRKGWYIYFWTLNVFKSLALLEQKLNQELEQLEAQLRSRKEKRYYSCKTCNLEVSEEAALLNDFTCSECEQVYTLSEKDEIIKELEKEIDKVKKEISLVAEERKKEGDIVENKKSKKIKRAEADRIKKKAEARKKTMKLKEKNNPKKTVKVNKKKASKKTIKKTSKKNKKKKQ